RVASSHLSGLHAHTHPPGRHRLRLTPAGSVNRMTELDLNGRVALVTGGSRGIGAATAVRLAEAGADVAVGCGQHRDAAEEIAGKITGLGRRAVVVAGDMADADVPRRIVAET